MARCMLLESKLPPSMWDEAIATANHIRNRFLADGLKGSTPYEKWYGKKANLKYLQVFKCKTFFPEKDPKKTNSILEGSKGNLWDTLT